MKKILFFLSLLMITTTLAFAQCDAPTNVQVNARWDHVNLSWTSPETQQSCDGVLSYGGDLATGIGVGSTEPFTVAVRYPVSSLTDHTGLYLTKVSFTLYDVAVSSVVIKVWTGGSFVGGVLTPGTLVDSVPVPVSTLVANTPNTVSLINPIQIDGTQEIWIGYEVAAANTTAYPVAASDVELTNLNNLVELNGEWDNLAHAGLPDYGWMIDGCLQITPPTLTGFNVLRDGVQLNASLLSPSTTSYVDNLVSPLSSYCYEIQSVCTSATQNSDQVCVNTPAQPNCGPMIGNGTGTTYEIPFNTFYKYSYVQQLFTAAELGVTEGTIESLTFNYFYDAPITMNDITIYLANVNVSTFASESAWIPAAELTQVFHGSILCSNTDSNKVTVSFDDSFEWDGQRNIVVAILNNQGSYENSYDRFNTHTTTDHKVLASCTDNGAYNIASPGTGTLFSVRNNMQFCFGPAPTCFKPSSIVVTDITDQQATISWTAHSSDDSQWDVVVTLEGQPVESGTTYSVSDTFVTVSDLAENVVYDVYVRTSCTETDQSAWIQSSFRTRCISIHEGIPYIENFTDYGQGEDAFPSCWTRSTNYASSYPYIVSASPAMGQMIFSSDAEHYSLAVSQGLDLSAYQGGSLLLSYWIGQANETSGRLDVGVMTDPNDLGTFTLLKSYYPGDYAESGTFQEESILLTETYGSTVYFAFLAPQGGHNSAATTHLTKVKVDLAPTCSSPANLVVADVTGTAAVLNWQEAPYGVETYTLLYSEAGQEMTSVEVTGDHYMLTNLTQGTEYDVMLFANCPEGEPDTLVTSFTTLLFVECTQEDTIGTEISGSTSTTTYELPVNNYYNYTYSQQIYKADEINQAHTPTVITAISFKYDYSSPSTNKNDVKIYLAHRPSNAFASTSDWTPIDNATLVYEGNLNCSQGWNKFNLDNYFNYNGTDNLVLIVDDNSGDYNSSSCVFDAHTNTYNSTLYYRNDLTNPDPVNPPTGTLSTTRNDVKFFCCSQIVPVACPAPYLTVVAADDQSVTIDWVANGQENEWNLEVRSEVDMDWIGLGTVSAAPHTITDLISDLNYEIRLQAVCADENAEWAYATAYVPCAAVAIPIEENFDEYVSNYMACWTRLYNTGSSTPTLSGQQSYSGTKSLYFNCPANGNYAYAITPRLEDNTPMNNLLINFYAYNMTASHFIEVGIMSDPNDVRTYVNIGQFSPSTANTWEMGELITSNYIGNGYYVAFRVPQWYANDIFIDDVSIQEIPSCFHVSNIAISNITPVSADVTWTEGAGETQWNYLYGPVGTVNPQTDVPMSATTNAISLNGLSGNTLYEVYIQADCGGNEVSTWMHSYFRTACSVMTELPYNENLDTYQGATSTSINVLPNCWDRINTGTVNAGLPTVWDDASLAHSGNNSMYFYTYNSSTYADQYAILPEIDVAALPISNMQLSFFSRANMSTSPFEIQVGVMTDPTDPATFELVQTIQVIGTDYQYKEAYFSNYSGEGNFIALKIAKPASNENTGYIDDIVLDVIPDCSPVVNLSVSRIAGASALISWETGHFGTVANYTVEYYDAMTESWIVASDAVTSNSYFLSGLEPLTDYMVRVKVNCDGSESAWVTANFTTRCLSGGEIVIGNGTNTSSYIPSYSFYNYGYSQQLYLASELSGPTNITSVSMQMATLSQQRTYKIYLMNTTATNLSSWQTPSNAQLVYSGNLTLQVGWNTFEFNTPFAYNGTDNLLMIMVDETGTYVSGNSWYTHTTSGSYARYAYQDVSAYSISTVPSSGTISSITERNNVIFGGNCDPFVTCVAPNVYINNITTNSADVIWAPGYDETEWEMEYALFEDSVWTTISNPQGGLQVLDNLTANTHYKVRMRSICDPEPSEWTMADFRTECGVESIPFFEDFNSYGTGTNVFPSCWSRHSTYASSTNYPYITNNGDASNPGSLYFYASSSSYTMAVTPELDAELNTLEVTFYFHSSNTSNGMIVGVMTDPDDASTFVPVDTVYSTSVDVFDFFEIDLDSYTGDGKYVAFKTRNVNTNSMYLDNVNIITIPTCKRPNEMAVANIDMNEAQISWNERGGATSWIIEYGEAGFTPGEGTMLLVTTNPYTLSNLTSATEYDVYVRSFCGGTDTSDYAVNYVHFATSICPSTNQCEYRFVCKDSYGDGWNGASVSVKQNGVTVAVVAAENHGLSSTLTIDTVRVMLCDNESTTLVWNEGSFDSECSLALLSPNGVVIYDQNDMSAISSANLITFTTDCNAMPEVCNAPTDLNVGSITNNSAVATWNAGGNESSWVIGYKLHSEVQWQEVPVNNTPTYSLEGLTANSTYDFRVKAVCSAESQSEYVTTTFTTNPEVGIDNAVLSNSISLMPIPADKYIELSINSRVAVKEAVIYNAFGQMIQTVQLTDNHARISLEDYAAGMYFVRIASDNAVATKKFIKK